MLPPSNTGLFFWSWKQALQSCRKPATFLPFAVFAASQLVILAGLFLIVYPPFSFIFLPLQRQLYGETTVHYPNNFLVMPQMFEVLNIALSGMIGVWVIGRATVLFFNSGDLKAAKLDLGLVGKKFFHLFAAWIGQTALILSVVFGFVWLSTKAPASARTYLNVLRVLSAVLVSAIFTYTTAIILVERKPFWLALLQSARIFAGYVLVTFFLVALPALLQFPTQFLLANSLKVVRHLNPEIIAAVIATGVFLSMVSNYFMVSTITHLYRGISREKGIGK
jgi:hypothetical protein